MLDKANGIESILECGCNIGRNIYFLNDLLPNTVKSIIEISLPAFQFVTQQFKFGQVFNGSILESNLSGRFDLVFTMGVLIHIHPDDLLANMEKMFNYSNKYVLIGEYFNRTPVMIEYQGELNSSLKETLANFLLRVLMLN